MYHVSGPVKVEFGEINLGRFQNGIIILGDIRTRPVADQEHGESPATLIFTGKSAIVQIPVLEPTKLRDALNSIGGFFQEDLKIGTLASSISDTLKITEWDYDTDTYSKTDIWEAPAAFPQGPGDFGMMTVQEERLAITFLLLAKEFSGGEWVNTGKLFKTVPSYISG